MSIKPNRAAAAAERTLLTIADNPALAIPANTPFTVFFDIVMDGNMATGTVSQYIFRTAEYQGGAGGIIAFWNGTTGSNPGKFQWYFDGNGVARCMSAIATEAGKAYTVGVRRSAAGLITSFIVPRLQIADISPSAVLLGTGSSGTVTVTAALDSPNSLQVCGSSVQSDRQLDHSVSRLGWVLTYLTDEQLAMMAAGHEVTEFVDNVPLYLRLNGLSDIQDVGSNNLPVTVSGTFTEGTDQGYSYIAAPVAPSINGSPYINGSPQVNVATSYTAAPTSGTPLPVTSQRWGFLVNNVFQPISGANGTTYTPVPADNGKSIVVEQTATNGSGTPAVAYSTPAVISNGAVSVTLVPPAAESFYQRENGGQFVPLSGSWSGLTPPTRIEYQLYAAHTRLIYQPWTDAGATIVAGGGWTARPFMPAPNNRKKYRIAVRSLDANGNVMSATDQYENRFGIGDIGPFAGSSSPVAWTNNGSGCGNSPDPDSLSNVEGDPDSPSWTLWGNCGAASAMATYWSELTGVPVCVYNSAIGGVTLNDWVNKSSSPWSKFTKLLAFVGGKIGFVVCSVGSNDAASSTLVTSRLQHATKIRTLIKNMRDASNTANNQSLPVLWGGYNRRTAALDIPSNYVRMAENDIGDDPFVYHVQALDFQITNDGIHMTASEYTRYCTTRLRPVGAAMFDPAFYIRGPQIIKMTGSNGPTVKVKVKHNGGTAFVPNSTITGFRAYDANNTELTVQSVEITGPDELLVTASGTVARLTHLEGRAPDVGTPAFGNTTPPLPMMVETDMALQDPSNSFGYITSQPAPNGQTQRFVGATSNVTSASYSLSDASGNVVVGPLPFTITNNAFDFTITDIEPGSYTPQLLVTGADGVSSVTGTMPFSISGVSGGGQVYPDPPGVPTNVTAVAGVGSATVSFSAPTTGGGMITSYEVLASTGETQSGLASPITIQVASGVAVTFTVRAISDVGPGQFSAASNFVTPEAPPDTQVPILPGPITIIGFTQTSITFSWPAATDDVEVAGYETSVNTQPYEDAGLQQSRTLTNLVQETNYLLMVRAYDGAGNRSLPIALPVRTTGVPSITQLGVLGVTVLTITPKSGALKLVLPRLDTPAPRSRTIILGGQSTTITA